MFWSFLCSFAQANSLPHGAALAHPEWERTCSVYIERKTGASKTVDRSPPSELQVQALQDTFDSEYAEDQVQLQAVMNSCEWEWVDGFRLRDTRLDHSYKIGDDVKIARSTRGKSFAQIDSCLVAIVNNKVYFFVFPKWYDTIGAVPVFDEEDKKFALERKIPFISPMETLVRKWNPREGGQNNPIPIHKVMCHVLVLHRCVRTCVIDPSHEDCNCHSRCRTRPHCSNHANEICSNEQCKAAGAVEWTDTHNPLLLDYTVVDEDGGYQAKL